MSSKTNTRQMEGAALLVTCLGAFLTPFIISSINIAVPVIGAQFNMDAIMLSWIPTSAILASTVVLVPLGRIADIYGRKRVFMAGIIIFTIGSLLCAFANSSTTLIIFRLIQGIGSGMTFGNAVAILMSVFPARERGRVLGINVAAVYLALSLGPPLGGLLTEHVGWQGVFLVNVPLGLAVISVTWFKLKGEWAEARGEKFDLVGSIIYGLAIIIFMYGLSLLPGSAGILTASLGVVGAVVFIWWEGKQSSPVLHVDLFRKNTIFALSNLAALINYGSTFAITFLMSLYLQHIRGFNPDAAGLILLSMPAVQVITSPFSGRLSDRSDPGVLASTGMTLSTISLIMLIFLNQNTPLWYILIALMINGLGIATFSPPNTNLAMSAVDKKVYGTASAMLSTMRQLGFMISMAIAMLVFAIYIGRVEITPQYYGVFMQSLKPAFIIFAVFCFGGIFASAARGKVPRRTH